MQLSVHRIVRRVKPTARVLVTWAALTSWSLPFARAQSGSREPAEYRATVNEAVQEFELRNFEEARALFERAHALYPNARTERGIGLAAYELRKYVESVIHLQAALDSMVRPLEGKLRSDVEGVLARGKHLVARMSIETRPSAAQVLLDGRPIPANQRGEILLDMGQHTLNVEAEGYAAQRRSFEVKGGEVERIAITLLPLRVEAQAAVGVHASGPAAARQDRTQASRPWYRSPWFWVPVGAVVAGAAVGAGLLLRPNAAEHDPAYGGSLGTVFTGP